ncbi:hypothetical protein F2Q68_00012578 [Brassica cretica]|uniref:Uncharacterized protein n=1 Tax=Brassica cretica TaxID=69181 RepID=A0A8S9KZY8_BRACR|nr:hypothetical protein F2Q68_00012578 [Brassica cretica]
MGGWWRCLFAGDPTVDLSVRRRWGGEGLNRLRSFTCLFRSLEFFSSFSRSFYSDQECDSAWSPDETIIWRFFSVSHSFGESWVRVGSFFSRVVARVLEVSVAARDETRDSIRVSLVVSVFRSWVLDCGSALVSLFSHNKSSSCGDVASVSLLPEEVCPTCPTALRVRWVKWVYTYRDWRVGDTISSSLSRTTAPLVSGLLFVLFLLVASRFEPPFSPGARGNRGLSPLIPFPWVISLS